jgi:predicted kinase
MPSDYGAQPCFSSQGRLILVCGLPGAGKTTLARRLEELHCAVRLCPDEWMDALKINLHDESMRARIEALQWEVAQRLLSLGRPVIIEWGTWSRAERDALREGARALGAKAELHVVTASPEVLLERIQKRGREVPPISVEEVLRWQKLFEYPTPCEAALFDPPLVVEPILANPNDALTDYTRSR